MLTKTELAQKSDIPLSTTKYYMKHYGEYFQSKKVDGYSHPVYEDVALEVLLFIKEMMAEKLQKPQVVERLDEKFSDYFVSLTEVAKTKATAKATDNKSAGSSTIPSDILSSTSNPTALIQAMAYNLSTNESAIVSMGRMHKEHGEIIKLQEQQIGERDEKIKKQEEVTQNKDEEIEKLTTRNDDHKNQIEELEAKLEEEKKKYGILGLYKKK